MAPNVYTMLSEIDLFAEAMEKVARGEVKEELKEHSPEAEIRSKNI